MQAELYNYDQLSSSPFGQLWTAVGPKGLVAVGWESEEQAFCHKLSALLNRASRAFEIQRNTLHASQELSEYLAKQRRVFEIPIDWEVLPDFQRQALQATFAIPYGEVRSYGEIARQIGHPGASRAVGRAEATNPMPLVLPCHRVVGSDGRLHGYAGPGGLEMKRWLLKLEQG